MARQAEPVSEVRALIATALAAAFLSEPAMTSAAGGLQLKPCRLEGLRQAARCGVLDVPENPQRPQGRHLAIHVAVLPATGGHALPDPIVPLMGGPGEAAISEAATFAERFESLRKDHDVLLVDQRGTGLSGALSCKLFSAEHPEISLRDLFPVAAVASCEQELSSRADLTQYGYLNFASDLDNVRIALRYGPMNITAGSYGTRAAQVFIRAYPKSVRTVFLQSMVPIDIATPGQFAATSQTSLENLLSECLADSACQAAFPHIRTELEEVARQLDSGKVRVPIGDGSAPAPLERGRVAEWFRSRLYRPKSAAALPWTIHQAHLGNWKPIAEGILENARGADSALSLGLLLAITCNDDIPFVREQDVGASLQRTFLRDYRLRQQQAACRSWPKVSLPEGYRTPVSSNVPTLFASGDSDGGTPLWFTEHASKGFSNSISVVQRGQGHTEWNECLGRLYEQFVRTGSVRGLEMLNCQPVPRPPFKTS